MIRNDTELIRSTIKSVLKQNGFQVTRAVGQRQLVEVVQIVEFAQSWTKVFDFTPSIRIDTESARSVKCPIISAAGVMVGSETGSKYRKALDPSVAMDQGDRVAQINRIFYEQVAPWVDSFKSLSQIRSYLTTPLELRPVPAAVCLDVYTLVELEFPNGDTTHEEIVLLPSIYYSDTDSM